MKSPRCNMLARAIRQVHRRDAYYTLRSQSLHRCPECGAEVKVETGIMRCTVCSWRMSIHDIS